MAQKNTSESKRKRTTEQKATAAEKCGRHSYIIIGRRRRRNLDLRLEVMLEVQISNTCTKSLKLKKGGVRPGGGAVLFGIADLPIKNISRYNGFDFR